MAELQGELAAEQGKAREVVAAYDRKVAELEEESRARAEWAVETERRLTAELGKRAESHAATVRLLDAAEGNVVERTLLAQRLDGELALLRSQIALIQQSRWLKLGRAAGLGPRLVEHKSVVK